MTRIAWLEVRSVLESALELPPAERKPYLDRACSEPDLRRYLDSLLGSFEHAEGGFLEIPAAALADSEGPDGEEWTGQRIGPYKVLEEIGHGGMGAVYRAARVDQQYEQQVAIKVIRAGASSAVMLGRFRTERQILANLDHPNIARLLDGGAAGHSPYFVMELVEGVPIDRYCHDHGLSIREKLALFRTVCLAVQHAHHHLIVHRDLKPGNILVASDGTPKLLDFGIAKILNPGQFPGAPEPTAPMLRLLTLEYASPEQVRGEAITTATDIYSLGVVLHLLLTGQLPYPAAASAIDMAAAICRTEPAKPSALVRNRERRSFPSDLDTVLLKALQKDPRRRFGSVEQFSEDVRRCLEGLPVSARPDTFSYRAKKFVRRHTAATFAAALVLIALLAGLVVTLREARIAEAQSRRAEKRFNDGRRLANSLIFELHDSIKDLPGATPARKLLIDRAVQYLDGLAKEENPDSSFKTELAWAYQRLALLQGDSFSSNLGDRSAGVASIRKASALWDEVAKANPGNLENQLDMAYGHRVLGNMSAAIGLDGVPQLTHAIRISERLQKASPGYPRVLRELSREYESMADLLEGGGSSRGALGYLQKEYAILRSKPADPETLHGMAVVEAKLGFYLDRLGQFDEAAAFALSAVKRYRQLAINPTDATMRRELARVQFNYGEILHRRGEPAAALKQYQDSFVIIEPLAHADPRNVLFAGDLAGYYGRIGSTLIQLGRVSEGLAALKKQRAILQAPGSSSLELSTALAFHAVAAGDALFKKGDFAGALKNYDEAVSRFGSQSQDVAAVQVLRGSALARLGRDEEARSAYQKAIASSEAGGSDQGPYTLADAYFGLGNVFRHTGNVADAQAAYSKSLEQWKHIGHAAGLSPDGFVCGTPAQVERASKQVAISPRAAHAGQ